MPKEKVQHLLGEFLVDQSGKIVYEKLSDELVQLEPTKIPKALLQSLKEDKYKSLLRKRNLLYARRKIKNSVTEDNLIVQAISSIEEIDRTAHILVKRLREWYGLYNPEFEASLDDHQKFVELVLGKSREVLLKEIAVKETMGANLKEVHLQRIMGLAQKIDALYKEKQETLRYLEGLMKEYIPNLQAIAGTNIAGKLLRHTGSLKKLMILPASTIQILGAEKALFRHLRSGAKPPKFGYILHHPYVQSAKKQMQGKKARALADKLAIAARVDFFKGEFVADKLKKQLEKK